MSDIQEYSDVVQEVRGALNAGKLKLQSTSVSFKNIKTGKVDQYQSTDVDKVYWLKRARGYCLKFMLDTGVIHRYDGFKEADFDKLANFVSKYYQTTLEKQDLSVKGWNWGLANFTGNSLNFEVDNKLAFEVPLNNVSHSTTSKSEVTLEFHQNDDAAVSLMELRFHIPGQPAATNAEKGENTENKDPVEEFYENVLDKADIIQATGETIAVFTEIHCLTPRGRYDFKIYPTFLQLHGKTFDYKIPYTTVLRLFLLPHKDGRQMFFVVSLDPPIKQGQTRYPFIILLFQKDDEMTLELGQSDEDFETKYEGKLQREMSGLEYEVISRVFKAVTNRKITVPGTFIGSSGTNAISCSYKAATGFLYPLERGFIFIHKPPMHIRFDEVSSVNFARSAGSTRSFDFDVETKSGNMHTFVGIEKDEYGKLYDFVSNKKLRVKNIGGKLDQKQSANYADDMNDSDDDDGDHDAYLERMKAEGKDRYSDDEDDETDSSDESFNPGDSGSEVAEEYDSNPPTTSESDEDDLGSGPEAEAKREAKRKEKEKKKARTAKTVREPGQKKVKRKKNKNRDPDKPKRPMSGYMIWFNTNRESIKADNPSLSITELSKKAGELWKEMKDKTEWEEKHAKAKEEYLVAMEEYNKKPKKGGGSDEDESDSEDEKKPKKRAKKPSGSSKSPSKKVTESRAGAGESYKSKEFISSSSSSDEDKPLKKKAKKKEEVKKEVKKEESEEDKESSVGELPSDEEILPSPPSSGKGSGSDETDSESGSD
ncbi:FACT complex subunit SSRP1-like [Ylistrum balloti]|uniref:FACT complex subunit SSRP1-like n=1 Tax=Ylistrum balloti TaxID=509963 RepID=UPI002905C8E5|nr:FACT complex subunit SSRP1-like [Ylistrum balloti]